MVSLAPKVTVEYGEGRRGVKYAAKEKAAEAYVRPAPKVKQTAFANRVYYKPSLAKPVIRWPKVVRRSPYVLAIMSILEGLAGKGIKHPSTYCGGLTWNERIKCLKRQMEKLMAAKYTRELVEKFIPKATKAE